MVQPTKKDCERHQGGHRNWSCEHERPSVLPARDWVCQIHTHTKAKLGWQTQLVDGVLRVEHVEMCEILPKSLIN